MDDSKVGSKKPRGAAIARVGRTDLAHGDVPMEAATPKVAVEKRVRKAAGLEAIYQTMRYGVGAMGVRRTVRTLTTINKVDGFDCQSCAWPSPDEHRKLAEFCENGAKAVADELTRKKVGPEFFAEHSISQLLEQSDHWLNRQGRLTHPMHKPAGADRYEPISWDEAFQRIGRGLRELESPDQAVFYTSGKTVNEAAFLFQLFARQLGTNNLPDCSNMCHEASGAALGETIGIGKGTATLEDLQESDTIVIIGNNPGTNHPRMLTTLEAAKNEGATIVAVNPMPETGLMRVINPNPQDYSNPLKLPFALFGKGTPLADLYVPVRVNGDAALLQGVLKDLLERDRATPGSIVDRDFVETHTSGWDEFEKGLDATTWEEVVEGSGVDRETIQAFGDVLARSKRLTVLWCLGLTQHANGTDNVRQVVNLLLMGGHIGRLGAGPICVRGHSNVQGDRTMGIWEKPPEDFLSALDEEMGIQSPRTEGFDVVDALRAMHDGKVGVFFAISGNLFSAAPDTHYTARAFARCPLAVHVSTKLHRGHLLGGQESLLLPCLGRSETVMHGGEPQLSTVEDSMGIVNPTRGTEKPVAPGLLSDTEILVRTALATFDVDGPVDWEAMLDHDRVRDHIARVIPGFENFNRRIREGFFYLPNAARERKFATATGKARFSRCPLPPTDLADGELLMTTVRSHDQFNTVVYGMDDRYRGVWGGRRVIFLNRHDVDELGLSDGQLVDITSHFDGETRTVQRFRIVVYPIARRSAATYYPETNPLIAIGAVDRVSNQPAMKSVRITLQASPELQS